MGEIIDKQLLEAFEDEESEVSALELLTVLGKRQGFVTYNDILHYFPHVEDDVDQLEEVFQSLLANAIPYIEDVKSSEDEEAEAAMSRKNGKDPKKTNGNGAKQEEELLANIDTNDIIGLYMKEASRVPLLNAEEELDLAQRIERGRGASEELAQGEYTPERRDELHEYIQDGWNAREHLITANSRLVISVAKKYMGRGVPFLDLIQEGNIGLMRAAKKFDYKRGFKFSTYATWWIRQAVTRAVADHGRTIRVPVHMGDQISRMLRAQHRLKQELSRDPTVEELAEELEVTIEKVEHMIQVAKRPLSLQMPIGDEEDNVLGDFIEDQETPAPDDTAMQNVLREYLEDMLDKLPPREERILQLRYGLIDGRVHTLNEVGRKMGVTRERVRQIEAQALRRLRTPSIQRALRAFAD